MRVAERLGVGHCVATCNGTLALELLARALDLRGEVIVPSFTFVATAHALQWQGIAPVFCDIDHGKHLMDPSRVEELITPDTTGLIGVHLWGTPCDVDALAEIADRHDLVLLFDAAHAMGSTHGGVSIGNFGVAEIVSFHATKIINSGEGGAILTNDADLAARAALMRNFGFTGYDEVGHLGTNAKMSELSAAVGLTSLDGLDRAIEHNRENHLLYQAALEGIPGVAVLAAPENESHNHHYLVTRISEDDTGLSRDSMMDVLWSENVRARRYFYPGVHRMEPYATLDPVAGRRLPVTESVADEVLVLPTGLTIGPPEINAIAALMRVSVENAPAVSTRLREISP